MILRALALVSIGSSVQALTLDLPAGAELTREVFVESGARTVPVGVTLDGTTPTVLAKGAISIQSFRIAGQTSTTDLLAPIATSIEAAGFSSRLRCETQGCGGFDFRFSLELIPPPHMFVDLADFLFLSAQSADGDSYVSVVVSRSATDGYVHVSRIAGGESPELETIAAPDPAVQDTPQDTDVIAQLENAGHIVLEDLIFDTGSYNLPEETYETLTKLSAYLGANPNRQIALVGHTDASGPLEINIAISRRRAEAAREVLVSRYGVSQSQVEAEGMGYLAPRASNLTEEGRNLNRRVEAILLPANP
ncbi:MAG: OmpA family protein [Pseudomonadota bacterium]